ncbi:MAG: phytanoyl-CoA dioxygenase family protein [Geminicoccaceae bacterium]|nr:phytanoyl-CoA dioxygenase family protein [Geminicoccaceae bacterium]MCX8101793.1 phytanoyl-CoA dioxygenase family protein [Geminicoccaceae bacterium]MDW8369639.1 phytanoyl-CoA dioxygenase family protein [Geminicoccaceae bacterium]
MISDAQVERYRRDGFIVVENVLSPAEVAELRAVTDALVEKAREVRTHDEVYDLEDSHTPEEPRVRRIKTPHKVHPAFERVMRHPNILAILQKLVAPAIRFDTSKLNMKAAGYGAAVEWHQDWAFYPHTNDDLAAVGVFMDDVALENGPLLCIPGTHKGPIFDHHDEEGYFCGAMDPERREVDYDAAVPCVGPAGSISIHHARTVHGSAVNTSNRPRRLLLFQYRAADAWPLVPSLMPKSMEEWNALLLCGSTDPVAPRLEPVPVRLPLPPARHQGSIYENQRSLKHSYFGKADAPRKVPVHA